MTFVWSKPLFWMNYEHFPFKFFFPLFLFDFPCIVGVSRWDDLNSVTWKPGLDKPGLGKQSFLQKSLEKQRNSQTYLKNYAKYVPKATGVAFGAAPFGFCFWYIFRVIFHICLAVSLFFRSWLPGYRPLCFLKQHMLKGFFMICKVNFLLRRFPNRW